LLEERKAKVLLNCGARNCDWKEKLVTGRVPVISIQENENGRPRKDKRVEVMRRRIGINRKQDARKKSPRNACTAYSVHVNGLGTTP
jgi:hypothetical protein